MLQEEIVKGRHLTPAPPLALQQKPGWERRHSAKFIGQGPKVFFGLKKKLTNVFWKTGVLKMTNVCIFSLKCVLHHALNGIKDLEFFFLKAAFSVLFPQNVSTILVRGFSLTRDS